MRNHHDVVVSEPIHVIDLRALCLAASCGDVETVRTHLLLNAATNVKVNDDEVDPVVLSPPTSAAAELYQLLFMQKLPSLLVEQPVIRFDNVDILHTSPSIALRSLLMLPHWSKTPWEAIKATIRSIRGKSGILGLHSFSTNHLLSYFAEIKIFLSTVAEITGFDTNAGVYDQSSTKYGKVQAEELTNVFLTSMQPIFMDPLLRTQELHSCWDATINIMSPFDLILPLLSVAERMDLRRQPLRSTSVNESEKTGLVQKLLNSQFQRDKFSGFLSPHFVLPFLSTILDCFKYMRTIHWCSLKHMLDDVLDRQKSCVIPSNDLPGIAKILANFLSRKYCDEIRSNDIPGVDSEQIDRCITWEDLLLRVYELSYSRDRLVLLKVESTLRAAFMMMPRHIIVSCITHIKLSNLHCLPSWIKANFTLLFFQQQPSGSQLVRKLISEVVERKEKCDNMEHIAFDCFLLLSQQEGYFSETANVGPFDFDRFKAFFRLASYSEGGTVSYIGEDLEFSLVFSQTVQLIYTSLFPMNVTFVTREFDDIYVLANMWIRAAVSLLDNIGDDVVCVKKLICVTAIFTVIFMELPCTRSNIITQHIVPVLAGDINKGPFSKHQSLYCVIACIITKVHVTNQDYTLTPIFDLISRMPSGNSAPSNISVELADLLSIHPLGRKAVGLMMKKYLKFPGTVGLGKHSANDRFDIALKVTLILVKGVYTHDTSRKVEPMDSVGCEALKCLTNIIVWNTPSIPQSVRNKTILELIQMINEGLLNDWTKERLLSAGLRAILCHFVVVSYGRRLIHTGLLEEFKGQIDFVFSPGISLTNSLKMDELCYLLHLIYLVCEGRELKTDDTAKRDMREFVLELSSTINARSDVVGTNTFVNKFNVKGIACLCMTSILSYILKQTWIDYQSSTMLINQESFKYESTFLEDVLISAEEVAWETIPSRSVDSSGVPAYRHWWNIRVSFIRPTGANQSSIQIHTNDVSIAGLFSVFIGIFLSFLQDSYTKDSEMTPMTCCSSVYHALCTLLNRRRYSMALSNDHLVNSSELLESNKSKDARIHRVDTAMAFSLEYAETFFNVSCIVYPFFLNTSIDPESQFQCIMAFLSASFEYCAFVINIEKYDRYCMTNEKRDVIKTASSIWKFYRYFMSILDYFYSSSTQQQHARIRTSNDVDAFLRVVRRNLINCIRTLIVMKDFVGPEIVPFCASIIKQLSDDLFTALQGVSGGMTKALYEVFVVTIVEGARKMYLCISDQSIPFKPSDLHFARCQIENSSSTLWNALCTNDVKFITLLKQSLLASIWEIPRLIRLVDRILVMTSSSKENELIMVTSGKEAASSLMMALRQSYTLFHGWNYVDTNRRADVEIGCFCQIGSKLRERGGRWPHYNLICLFAADKTILEVAESIRIFGVRQMSNLSRTLPEDKNLFLRQKQYTTSRAKLVLGITQCLYHFLYPIQCVEDDGTSLLAAQMPTVWKKRYCSCLLHLFGAFKSSFRVLRQLIRRFSLISRRYDSSVDGDHETSFLSDVRLGDVLACLLVWLDPSGTDSTSLLTKWYDVERDTIGSDSVSRCIENIFGCLDDLHLERRKLVTLLRFVDRFSPLKCPTVSTLDTLCSNVLTYSWSTDSMGSFMGLKMLLSNQRTSSMMPVCRNDGITVKSSNKSQKRLISRVSPRSSCRKSRVRSQNRLVDQWLDLDEQLREKGENDRYDAYTDLEDFLVEG